MRNIHKHKEDSLLSKCHLWLWNTHPETRHCCWHIANERVVNPIQGAILKSKGVVAGTPDYVVNWGEVTIQNGVARTIGKTYYFEFKSDKGVQSKEQIKAQAALTTQGFAYFIIQDECTFKEIIHQILTNTKTICQDRKNS
jgi:hypothetical protein